MVGTTSSRGNACGVQDAIGEVIVAIPKPRGEGAWAYCRYYLIRLHRWANNEQYTCRVVGCPHAPLSKYVPGVCEMHGAR
jgi:hypothetical protein